MGFLAIMNAYTMRISLSIAITEMVNKSHGATEEDGGVCPIDESANPDDFTGGEFDWDEELQGIILSSFYWGYVITHIPGGMLAEKFGGKWTLSLGILSTAFFTLITPWAVELGGSTALIVIRVMMGLGEGTTFPALSALMATWIPAKERSKLGSLVFGGGQVGTILGNLLSGVLLHNIEGWSSVFYFFGGLGVLWFVIFTLLCYSDPESHPFISEKEKAYLKQELGTLERDRTLPPTPWRYILTSVPMMALVCAQIGHDWGFFIMVTDLPKYMSDVLRFSIKDNGLYSSLPYLIMWIVSLSTGVLSDWLITSGRITITFGRKLFTTIASIGPACFIVGASYAGCEKAVVVMLFTFAMGLMGTFYPGMKVNPLDLSPNYAGTLMAITNGIGAITGIIAPYVVGVMTPNHTLEEWRIVFWISFAIFNVTNLAYIIWASGEVQPWNTPHLMNKSAEAVMTGDRNDTMSGVAIADKDFFDWDEHEQGIILSAFYWGYTLSHFVIAFIADRYSKHLLGLSVLITAVLTILTPLAIDVGGKWLLIMVRVVEGIGEGATFPVLSALIAHWIPASQRGFYGSFVFSGCQIGALVGGIGTGYFIEAHNTWRTTFYIWGALAIIWYVFWLFIGFESPETHPYISEQERAELVDQLAESRKSVHSYPIPWNSILRSCPLWGLIAGQIGHDWGTYLIITDLPKYMKSILHVSVSDNGIVTYTPFFSMWLFSIFGGWLCDVQIRKDCMSRTNARKLWTTIGSILPACFMMAASYTGQDKVMVVTYFALCVTFLGGFYPGVKVNTNDLSPNFAGVLMGMVNGIGAITE
uniref:Major facilitator superfamily (MFS) profile domain-containing protein n=1 Tax=Anopheles melas TaxID=34690 RepID=A0A182TKA0_9DIPT